MIRLCDNCKINEGKSFWVTGAFICDDCKKDWERKFEETRKIDIKNDKKNTIFNW